MPQRVAVEPTTANCFESLDESLECRDDECEPVWLDEFAPAMPSQFPPVRRQIGGARMIDLEELGAECRGPQREHTMDAVAGEPRAKQTWRWQTAPRWILHIPIAC